MKCFILGNGLVLLSLMPFIAALPSWLNTLQRDSKRNIEPRGYEAYATSQYGGHYSYGGYGPQPTLSTSSSSQRPTSTAEGILASSTTVSTGFTPGISSGISFGSYAHLSTGTGFFTPLLPSYSASSYEISASGTFSAAGFVPISSSITTPLTSLTTVLISGADTKSNVPIYPSAPVSIDDPASASTLRPTFSATHSQISSTPTSLISTNKGGATKSSLLSGSPSYPGHYIPSSSSLSDPATTKSLTSVYSSVVSTTEKSNTNSGVMISSGSGLTQTGDSSLTIATSEIHSSGSNTSSTTIGSISITSRLPATMTDHLISTSKSATTSSIECHHNNCYRQMIKSLSRVSSFCATYTQAINIATTGLPSFVSNCGSSPTKISSACSCLVAPTASISPQISSSRSPVDGTSSSSTSSEVDITLTSKSTRTITTTRTSPSIGPTVTGTGVSSGTFLSSSGPVLYPNSTSSITASSNPSTSVTGTVGNATTKSTPTNTGDITSSDSGLTTTLSPSVSVGFTSTIVSGTATAPFPVHNSTSSFDPPGTNIPPTSAISPPSTVSSSSSSSLGAIIPPFPTPCNSTYSVGPSDTTSPTGFGSGVSSASNSTLGSTGTPSVPYPQNNSTLYTGPTGTVFPTSSASSTLYVVTNSSSTFDPTKTGSPSSSASGVILASSGSPSAPYQISNSTTFVGPTGTGSLISSASGTISLSRTPISTPYPISNSTSNIGPTGTGASTSSGSGEIISSIPFSTSNSTSYTRPIGTGVPSSFPSGEQTGGISSSVPYPTPCNSTYASVSIGTSSITSSGSSSVITVAPFPVTNSTKVVGATGTGADPGVSSSISALYPTSSNSTFIGGSTGTGSLTSSGSVEILLSSTAPYPVLSNSTIVIGPTGTGGYAATYIGSTATTPYPVSANFTLSIGPTGTVSPTSSGSGGEASSSLSTSYSASNSSISAGSSGTGGYLSSAKSTPCNGISSTPYPLPSSANLTSVGPTSFPTSSGGGGEISSSSSTRYLFPTLGNSTLAPTGFSTSLVLTGSHTSSGSGDETSLSGPAAYPTYSPPKPPSSSGANSVTSTADGLSQSEGFTSTPSTFVTFTGTAPGTSSVPVSNNTSNSLLPTSVPSSSTSSFTSTTDPTEVTTSSSSSLPSLPGYYIPPPFSTPVGYYRPRHNSEVKVNERASHWFRSLLGRV